MKITDTSNRTEFRDLADLVEKKMLVRNGDAGRNTSYRLAEPKLLAASSSS
jgi:hypothetical protein